MINNDVLRSIRYMLDLSDNKVIEIIRLADPEFAIEKEDVRAFLLREDEPGYLACTDRVMAHFLDGLVIHRRGRDESLPPRAVEGLAERLKTAPSPTLGILIGLAILLVEAMRPEGVAPFIYFQF